MNKPKRCFCLLFLCVLICSLSCCNLMEQAPSSEPIVSSAASAPADDADSSIPMDVSSSAVSSLVSSEPPVESKDVLQMTIAEYEAVEREYDIMLLKLQPPSSYEKSEFLNDVFYSSFVYGKCIDQNTVIDAARFRCEELMHDTTPRKNYFYWAIQDFPDYWIKNPETAEYMHLQVLYPIIPEPITCYMLYDDMIWYGNAAGEVKSAKNDGSNPSLVHTFDAPIKQFKYFDNAMMFVQTENAIYRFFTPDKTIEKIADVAADRYVLFDPISNRELAWVEVDSSWYLDENGIPAFDYATPEERSVMYLGKTCYGNYVNWHSGKTVSDFAMPYNFAFMMHGSESDPHRWYDAFRPGTGCKQADLAQWLADYKE